MTLPELDELIRQTESTLAYTRKRGIKDCRTVISMMQSFIRDLEANEPPGTNYMTHNSVFQRVGEFTALTDTLGSLRKIKKTLEAQTLEEAASKGEYPPK